MTERVPPDPGRDTGVAPGTATGDPPRAGTGRWKWALWFLVSLNLGLAASGVIEMRDAVALVLFLEIAALVLGIALLLRGISRARLSATSPQEALLAVFATLLPDSVARFVVLELLTFTTLFRWLLRRRSPGSASFAYHERSWLGALTLLVLLTTPAELLLLHLLVPWSWVRWLLLALALYGLAWLLGLWAGFRVYPHHLERDRLVLRYSFLHELSVPLAAIETIRAEPGRSPNGRDGLHVRDGVAWLAVGGRTDLVVELRAPVEAKRFLAPVGPIHRIHVAVDRPEQLLRALAEPRTAASAHPSTEAAPSRSGTETR
ncbi:MAG: hypothetical protein RMK01_00045 [Thermomicrobium sp.]|nr:hypothetical protein [Thermomicrobium sp.]